MWYHVLMCPLNVYAFIAAFILLLLCISDSILASRTGCSRVETITTWINEVLRPYANSRPFHYIMNDILDMFPKQWPMLWREWVQYIRGGLTSLYNPWMYSSCGHASHVCVPFGKHGRWTILTMMAIVIR